VSARAGVAPLPLVIATAAMALLALFPWVMGPAAPAIPPSAPGATLPRLAALPPFADFAAIAARPLFAPTRRPDAARAASGIAARYRLLGIVIAGAQRHALLAPIAGGPALELAEGGTVEGWTLVKIEDGRVMLSSPTLGAASLAMAPPAPAPRQRP
jgi:hypothetical protein